MEVDVCWGELKLRASEFWLLSSCLNFSMHAFATRSGSLALWWWWWSVGKRVYVNEMCQWALKLILRADKLKSEMEWIVSIISLSPHSITHWILSEVRIKWNKSTTTEKKVGDNEWARALHLVKLRNPRYLCHVNEFWSLFRFFPVCAVAWQFGEMKISILINWTSRRCFVFRLLLVSVDDAVWEWQFQNVHEHWPENWPDNKTFLIFADFVV